MAESRLVQAETVRLEVYEAGPADAARTAVLVHGASSSARIWAGVQRHLAAAGIGTFAIGMRGAGASDRTPHDADYQPRQYAADLAAAIRALGLDGFTLAGHSLGARVVTRYVLEHDRARVRALALLAGVALTARPAPSGEEWARFEAQQARPRDPEAARYAAWEPNHVGLPPDERQALWRDIEANPPQRARGQRLAEEPDHLGALAALPDLPVLIVVGDADATVTPEPALRTYLALPPARRSLHVLHGIGHFPNAQVPDRVAEVFARFMGARTPAGARA